eukprot:TRINITY_DN2650_c0_g1_i1.p1 TRINITY_DN2650_c0_g1~~TRINITY_DN2650_c0_g1_i1.p1  ORF type:complete len:1194 (+),score=290.13 TRINITY_DN2650_c0_g1_i1:63-3644(+)
MSLQHNKPELYHVLESSSNYTDNTNEITGTKSERFVLDHGKELRQKIDPDNTHVADQISKEIREYKQLMNQFQCRDYPQLGIDTPFNIEGGVNFYQFLCRGTPPAPSGSWREIASGGQKLRLLIPDTIVYGMKTKNGSYGVWLASSPSGVVHRKDIFTPQDVVAALGDLSVPNSKVVAVLKKKKFNPLHSTETTLLDTRELRATAVVSSTAPSDTVQVVQRFIKPRSHRAFICRCTWSPDKPAFAHMATNHRAMNDESERNISSRYLLNTENHGGCTIFKMSSSAVDELAKLTRQIAKHVERVTPGVRFETLVTDFTRDDQNRWWLLQIKAFKLLTRVPTSIGYRQNKDESSYRKMTACGACKAAYRSTELTDLLNLGQIKKMVNHLYQRGVELPWMERTDLHLPVTPHISESSTGIHVYRRVYVCKVCYELYMAEMKLIETEKAYLKEIGTKIDESDDGFVFPDAPLGVRSASSIAEDSLLNPYHFDLKGIPDNTSPIMKMYKLFFVFHGVQGFEPIQSKYPISNRYGLQTTIFGQNFVLPLLIPQLDTYTRRTMSYVNKTFLKYIFSSEQALYVFFAMKTIKFKILAPDCEVLGHFNLDLSKAIDKPLSKHELTCMIVSDILPRCRFRVSFGFDEVKACDLRLVEVLKSDFKGIYIPAPSFYAPEPISTEWLNMIKPKEAIELDLLKEWFPPSKTLNVEHILNSTVNHFTISIFLSKISLFDGFSLKRDDELRFDIDDTLYFKSLEKVQFLIQSEEEEPNIDMDVSKVASFKVFFNIGFQASQKRYFEFLDELSIISLKIYVNNVLLGITHFPVDILVEQGKYRKNMGIFCDDELRGEIDASVLSKQGLSSSLKLFDFYETEDEEVSTCIACFFKPIEQNTTSISKKINQTKIKTPIFQFNKGRNAEKEAISNDDENGDINKLESLMEPILKGDSTDVDLEKAKVIEEEVIKDDSNFKLPVLSESAKTTSNELIEENSKSKDTSKVSFVEEKDNQVDHFTDLHSNVSKSDVDTDINADTSIETHIASISVVKEESTPSNFDSTDKQQNTDVKEPVSDINKKDTEDIKDKSVFISYKNEEKEYVKNEEEKDTVVVDAKMEKKEKNIEENTEINEVENQEEELSHNSNVSNLSKTNEEKKKDSVVVIKNNYATSIIVESKTVGIVDETSSNDINKGFSDEFADNFADNFDDEF